MLLAQECLYLLSQQLALSRVASSELEVSSMSVAWSSVCCNVLLKEALRSCAQRRAPPERLSNLCQSWKVRQGLCRSKEASCRQRVLGWKGLRYAYPEQMMHFDHGESQSSYLIIVLCSCRLF